MSNIRECDHCKKTFSDSNMTVKAYTPTKIFYGDMDSKRKYMYRFDLCHECSEKFFEWMYKHDSGDIK